MNPKFRLTKPAIQDIEKIADYIATQSGLDRADRFLTKLDAKFAKIAQFPNLGRQRDEILLSLRSLPMDNYLILKFNIWDICSYKIFRFYILPSQLSIYTQNAIRRDATENCASRLLIPPLIIGVNLTPNP